MGVVVALLAATPSAAAAAAGTERAPDYKFDYIAGLRAKAEERWSDALTFFTEARDEARRLHETGELREDPLGELIRPYGTWTESFVPGYYRGLALFELGRFAAALTAWQEGIQILEARRPGREPPNDHPLGYPRNAHLLGEMEERLDALPTLLVERYEALRIELDRVEAEAEHLGRFVSSRGAQQDLEDLGSLSSKLQAVRQILGRRLAAGPPGSRGPDGRLAAASALREDEEQFRELLDELEDAEELRLAIVTVQSLCEEEAARQARRRVACEAQRAGGCEGALDILRDLAAGDEGLPQASDGIALWTRLAEASRDCRRMDAAEMYSRLADRFDPSAASSELACESPKAEIDCRPENAEQLYARRDRQLEEIELVARDVAGLGVRERAAGGNGETAAAQLDAVGDYLEALAWIALGECRQEPESLIQDAMAALFQLPDAGRGALAELNVAFTPYLALARADYNCGRSEALHRNLDLAREFRQDAAAAIAAIERGLGAGELPFRYGGSYALIVSISDYDEKLAGWSPLEGAGEDVEPVRQALAQLGFQVLEPVRDPDRFALEEALEDFVADYGKDSRNRLVVYYAGHAQAWKDKETGEVNGFLVPKGATKSKRSLVSFEQFELSAGLRTKGQSAMRAHHAMFVFDACFGAAIFHQLDGQVTREPDESEAIETQMARSTRFFLTAGNEDQKVPDFSVFRRFFTLGLGGGADLDGDGIVLGRELGHYVRPFVSALADEERPTTPQMAWQLAGGAPGDIGFKRTPNRDWADLALPDEESLLLQLAVWAAVEAAPGAEVYEEFRRVFGERSWLGRLVGRRLVEADSGVTSVP